MNFKLILILLITFTNYIGNCSSAYPKSDILFYQKDTLFVDKIHSELILRKISKSKTFNTKYAPFRVNQYTAYWRIENNKLYLIKVSNCQTRFCSNENENDTLNLQKSFKLKYKNGKVDFTPRNGSINIFDTFILRSNYAWYPTFYKNYVFHFKKRSLNDIDTTLNYSNDVNRLKRLTYGQINLTIYDIIHENIKVFPSKTDRKKLYIELSVSIDYSGKMSDFQLINYCGNNFYDSIPEDSIQEIINLNLIRSKLEETKWDKITSSASQKDNFIYKLNLNLEKNKVLEYNKEHRKEERRVYASLPKYIKELYE